RIHAAEDAVRDRIRDLVLEGVASERGVIHLDVELDLALEAEALQERIHRRDVVVVLMFGGLVWLGLDQERAWEADAVLLLAHQRHEAPELLELTREVRVEERLVALAPAPQHVVRAAEPVRRLEAMLHLGRRMGEHLGIRIRGGARRVARVAEQVGGAPEQAHAGALHVALRRLEQAVETRAALGEGGALGREIAVVEAEERDAELLEQLEGHRELVLGLRHRITARSEPRAREGALAEHVVARPAEAVPEADREAELILHALAEDLAVGVVPAEGERGIAGRSLVADLADALEVLG